jgi:hypothetical protein
MIEYKDLVRNLDQFNGKIPEDPVEEPQVVEPAVEYSQDEFVQQDVLEDNVEQDVLEDNVEQDVLEDNVEQDVLEDNFEQDVLEDNVEQDVLEDNFEQDVLEDNVAQDVLEDNVEQDVLEDNVEQMETTAPVDVLEEQNLEDQDAFDGLGIDVIDENSIKDARDQARDSSPEQDVIADDFNFDDGYDIIDDSPMTNGELPPPPAPNNDDDPLPPPPK